VTKTNSRLTRPTTEKLSKGGGARGGAPEKDVGKKGGIIYTIQLQKRPGKNICQGGKTEGLEDRGYKKEIGEKANVP